MCCLRLVLSDGNWIPVHKGSLSHLGLFQRKPELLRGDEYRLESDVTQEILTLFLARVWGDAGSHIVTHENWESLIFLCNEFEFGGFDADFRAVWAKLRDQMNQKDTQIQDLQRQVRALRSFCGLQKDMLLQFQACWAPRPMSKTCLIATLREQEAALGTEMVVLRQSSRDLYNTLDPVSSDEYQSSSIASGWIEIKFKEPVQVNGFKLISSRRQPNDNLKKFAAGNLFPTVKQTPEKKICFWKFCIVNAIEGYYLRYYPLFPHAFGLWPKLSARYGVGFFYDCGFIFRDIFLCFLSSHKKHRPSLDLCE